MYKLNAAQRLVAADEDEDDQPGAELVMPDILKRDIPEDPFIIDKEVDVPSPMGDGVVVETPQAVPIAEDALVPAIQPAGPGLSLDPDDPMPEGELPELDEDGAPIDGDEDDDGVLDDTLPDALFDLPDEDDEEVDDEEAEEDHRKEVDARSRQFDRMNKDATLTTKLQAAARLKETKVTAAKVRMPNPKYAYNVIYADYGFKVPTSQEADVETYQNGVRVIVNKKNAAKALSHWTKAAKRGEGYKQVNPEVAIAQIEDDESGTKWQVSIMRGEWGASVRFERIDSHENDVRYTEED